MLVIITYVKHVCACTSMHAHTHIHTHAHMSADKPSAAFWSHSHSQNNLSWLRSACICVCVYAACVCVNECECISVLCNIILSVALLGSMKEHSRVQFIVHWGRLWKVKLFLIHLRILLHTIRECVCVCVSADFWKNLSGWGSEPGPVRTLVLVLYWIPQIDHEINQFISVSRLIFNWLQLYTHGLYACIYILYMHVHIYVYM